eukprot:scaffold1726_cov260-Pinguiococcus_pyrenoidosus.AAC.8
MPTKRALQPRPAQQKLLEARRDREANLSEEEILDSRRQRPRQEGALLIAPQREILEVQRAGRRLSRVLPRRFSSTAKRGRLPQDWPGRAALVSTQVVAHPQRLGQALLGQALLGQAFLGQALLGLLKGQTHLKNALQHLPRGAAGQLRHSLRKSRQRELLSSRDHGEHRFAKSRESVGVGPKLPEVHLERRLEVAVVGAELLPDLLQNTPLFIIKGASLLPRRCGARVAVPHRNAIS